MKGLINTTFYEPLVGTVSTCADTCDQAEMVPNCGSWILAVS